MEHSYFRDKVSAYHDRELPAQELAMLGEHIASCPECQKLLAEFERLDQIVADRIELGGGDYWEQSAQKIDERLGFVEKTEITPIAKPSWDKSLVWKLTAVAASVAVLVFIGINKDDIFKRSIPAPEQKQDIRENLTADSVADRTELESTLTVTNELGVQDKATNQTTHVIEAQDEKAKDTQSTAWPKSAGKLGDSEGMIKPTPTLYKSTPPADVRVQSSPEERVDQKARLAAPSTSTPTADSAPPAAIPVTLSAPSLQREVPDMAASTAEAESAVAQTKNELTRWRQLRDSLSLALETPKQSMAEKYGITGFQKSEKSKKAAAASSLRSVDTRVETEKQYIEACYQIALLTDDAEEYQSAKQSLEKIAGEVGSTNATFAGEYLTRLKSDRPTPPEK